MIRPASHSLDFGTAPVSDHLETAAHEWPDLDLSAETASLDEVICTVRNPVSQTMRIVGLLAFGQSLLFLIIWLLVCASAGAANPPPEKKPEFKPELQTSTYVPTKARDPFAAVGAVNGSVAPSSVALQLEGILFTPGNPSAVVNGQLLTLNKIVFLTTATGDIQLKAVEITRDRVLIAVGDGAGSQTVKLFLNQQSQAPTPSK